MKNSIYETCDLVFLHSDILDHWLITLVYLALFPMFVKPHNQEIVLFFSYHDAVISMTASWYRPYHDAASALPDTEFGTQLVGFSITEEMICLFQSVLNLECDTVTIDYDSCPRRLMTVASIHPSIHNCTFLLKRPKADPGESEGGFGIRVLQSQHLFTVPGSTKNVSISLTN